MRLHPVLRIFDSKHLLRTLFTQNFESTFGDVPQLDKAFARLMHGFLGFWAIFSWARKASFTVVSALSFRRSKRSLASILHFFFSAWPAFDTSRLCGDRPKKLNENIGCASSTSAIFHLRWQRVHFFTKVLVKRFQPIKGFTRQTPLTRLRVSGGGFVANCPNAIELRRMFSAGTNETWHAWYKSESSSGFASFANKASGIGGNSTGNPFNALSGCTKVSRLVVIERRCVVTMELRSI